MEAAMVWGEYGQSGLAQTYPAVPRSVAAIRRTLNHFAREAGAPPGTADAIALAASEAATNVLLHAYRDCPQPGTIEIIGVLAEGHLIVTVRDSGSGLKPRADSPGLGLGLAIIAQAADRLDLVESPTGGLEVRLYFSLAPTAPD